MPFGPNGIGTKSRRHRRSHGASHAELTRLIRTRGHNTVLGRIATNYNGFAAPRRMIELLNGSEERIEVDKQNGATTPRRQNIQAYKLGNGIVAIIRRDNAHCSPVQKCQPQLLARHTQRILGKSKTAPDERAPHVS